MKLYLYGAAAIVIAVLLSTALYFRANAIKAQAKLAVAEKTLKDRNTQISKMEAATAANQKIMVGLQADIAAIHAERDQTVAALNKLRTTDKAAAQYLDTRLPDSVSALLNKKAK